MFTLTITELLVFEQTHSEGESHVFLSTFHDYVACCSAEKGSKQIIPMSIASKILK